MAATCLRVSQNLLNNFAGITRRNYLPQCLNTLRKFADDANQKTQTEPTENEKKLTTSIEALNNDIADLKEKCSDLDDKYKRSLADAENLRRRLSKQIEDAKLFGIQSFCKDLLTVSDILHQATEAVPKDELSKNSHLKNLYEGLTMTEKELQKVFKRHGLVKVEPLGEKFDPNFHEALFESPMEGKESGTVIAVTKIGYKLHERTIRPAMVGVAK